MAIHTADRPAQVPSNNNEFWTPLRKGVAIGLATAALLGGAAKAIDVLTTPKPVDETSQDKEPLPNTEPIPTAINYDGYVGEIEKITADGIITKDEVDSLSNPSMAGDLDPASLVGVYGADFDSWRAQAYNYISPLLSSEQKRVLNEGQLPTSEKSTWPQQAIFNQIALDIADTTIQDTKYLGQRMLPTIVSPSTPGYSDVFHNAEGGTSTPDPTIVVYEAGDTPYPKPNGSFLGVEELSENAQVLYGTYIEGTGDDSDATRKVGMLVDLVKSPDGSSENWRKLGLWNANDPQFQIAISDLQ